MVSAQPCDGTTHGCAPFGRRAAADRARADVSVHASNEGWFWSAFRAQFDERIQFQVAFCLARFQPVPALFCSTVCVVAAVHHPGDSHAWRKRGRPHLALLHRQRRLAFQGSLVPVQCLRMWAAYRSDTPHHKPAPPSGSNTNQRSRFSRRFGGISIQNHRFPFLPLSRSKRVGWNPGEPAHTLRRDFISLNRERWFEFELSSIVLNKPEHLPGYLGFRTTTSRELNAAGFRQFRLIIDELICLSIAMLMTREERTFWCGIRREMGGFRV